MSNRNVTINDLDRPDYIPNPQPATYTPRRSGRGGASVGTLLIVALFGLAFILLIGYALVGWLSDMYRYSSWFATLVHVGTALVIVALFAGIVAGIGAAILGAYNLARRAGLADLPGGVPVHISALSPTLSEGLAGRFLDVKQTEADRSAFRNVTSYAPSTNYGSARGATADNAAPTHQPEPATLATDAWVAALNEAPHLLIYGPSKAGKSTLAQAYAATFAGAEVVIIDPQPNKPGESKWGGVDFVTLDTTGGDEYGRVKTALHRIATEDDRRRRTMDTETFAPLIVIIDEVLSLVDALGSVKVDNRREPIIARFIRAMGYSARHRNIKIILIGQGKNLADLGLSSATARNNYALVRVERNPATNQRAAFIDTPTGEQAIDLASVPTLANDAAQRVPLWLTHADCALQPAQEAPGGTPRSVPPDGATIPLATAFSPEQYSTERRDRLVRLLFSKGYSVRKVGDAVRLSGYAIDNDRLLMLRQQALAAQSTTALGRDEPANS